MGMASNYYFYLHGYTRSGNLSCPDPFCSYLLIPEERRKTFGLRWNQTQVLLLHKRPLYSRSSCDTIGCLILRWMVEIKLEQNIVFQLRFLVTIVKQHWTGKCLDSEALENCEHDWNRFGNSCCLDKSGASRATSQIKSTLDSRTYQI